MNLTHDELEVLINLTRSVPWDDITCKLEAMRDRSKLTHFHYYLFTFQHSHKMEMGGSVSTTSTCSFRFPEMKISIAAITEVKRQLKVPQDSVVLNISYLGYMTEEEAK